MQILARVNIRESLSMNAAVNDYRNLSRQQLIEEIRQRAELMCSGEVMDLLCRQREYFVAETGKVMQALAAQLANDVATG